MRDRMFQVLQDEPGDGSGGGDGQQTGGPPEQGLDYFKAEAKKAFKKRDELAAKIKELEGRVISDEDAEELKTLRKERADIEEKRKRAEGQFDSLKQELVSKHEKERKADAERIKSLETYIEQTEIDRAFLGASSLFGGQSAKTVLTADIAAAYFRKYVDVVDKDGRKVVIVKNHAGDVIHGADGNPAPFEAAMAELIEGLPVSTRDQILRGSGKTGSGSSDGSKAGMGKPDLTGRLSQADFANKDTRTALHRRHEAAGGLVVGRAWSRK